MYKIVVLYNQAVLNDANMSTIQLNYEYFENLFISFVKAGEYRSPKNYPLALRFCFSPKLTLLFWHFLNYLEIL